MNRTRTASIAFALALVLVSTLPRPARAQSSLPSPLDPNGILGPAVIMPGVLLGIVSDIGIASGYASKSGKPGLGFAVLGSVCWGAVTAVGLLEMPVPNPDPGASLSFGLDAPALDLVWPMLAFLNLAYSVVAVGSSMDSGTKKLAVTPTAVIGPAGHAAPGLALAGRF